MWVFKVLYNPKLFWPRWKNTRICDDRALVQPAVSVPKEKHSWTLQKKQVGCSIWGRSRSGVFFLEGSQTDVIWCYYMLLSQALWSTSHFNSGIKTVSSAWRRLPCWLAGVPSTRGEESFGSDIVSPTSPCLMQKRKYNIEVNKKENDNPWKHVNIAKHQLVAKLQTGHRKPWACLAVWTNSWSKSKTIQKHCDMQKAADWFGFRQISHSEVDHNHNKTKHSICHMSHLLIYIYGIQCGQY